MATYNPLNYAMPSAQAYGGIGARTTGNMFTQGVGRGTTTMFSPVYDQTDVNPEVGAQMAAILLMLVMPSMGTVCRLRDGNSNTATATANPFIYQKANWVPYSTQPSQLVSTDFAIFFFRNLLRTVVFHIQTTSNSAPTFIYNAVFNPLANVPTQQQLQAQGQSNMMPVWYLPAQANTVSPHGPYQFCGFDGGYRGIWVDATPVNTATITGTMTGTPSATVQGVLYRWDVSWWNPVSTGVNNVTDTITFAGIAFSGYFAVGVVATATLINPPALALSYQVTSPSVWAHLPSNATVASLNDIEGYRVLAVDALLSDEATDNTNQGNVVGAQLDQDTVWTSYGQNSQGVFQSIVNTRQMEPALLKFGMFSFLKPSDRSTFAYHNDFQKGASASVTSVACYPLHQEDDYLCMACSTTNPQGGDVLIKTVIAYEFKSTAQNYNYQPADNNLEAYKLATAAMGAMQQWYMNPEHKDQLIGRIVNTVNAEQAGPKAMKYMRPFLMRGNEIAQQQYGGVGKSADYVSGPTLQQQATSVMARREGVSEGGEVVNGIRSGLDIAGNLLGTIAGAGEKVAPWLNLLG